MIKITAHLSKKVPLEGIEYSSQQFSAGIEAEVACNADDQTIRDTLRRLYGTLEHAIDQQIGKASGEKVPAKPAVAFAQKSSQSAPRNGFRSQGRRFNPTQGRNGNGKGRSVGATPAQQKAIRAISHDLGIDLADALSGYGVAQPGELTVKQASALIDALKGQQAHGA